MCRRCKNVILSRYDRGERIKNALPIVIRIPQTFLAFCEHVGGHLLSLWAGTFDKAVPGILKELSVTWDKLNKPEDLLTLPGYLVALYALARLPKKFGSSTPSGNSSSRKRRP